MGTRFTNVQRLEKLIKGLTKQAEMLKVANNVRDGAKVLKALNIDVAKVAGDTLKPIDIQRASLELEKSADAVELAHDALGDAIEPNDQVDEACEKFMESLQQSIALQLEAPPDVPRSEALAVDDVPEVMAEEKKARDDGKRKKGKRGGGGGGMVIAMAAPDVQPPKLRPVVLKREERDAGPVVGRVSPPLVPPPPPPPSERSASMNMDGKVDPLVLHLPPRVAPAPKPNDLGVIPCYGPKAWKREMPTSRLAPEDAEEEEEEEEPEGKYSDSDGEATGDQTREAVAHSENEYEHEDGNGEDDGDGDDGTTDGHYADMSERNDTIVI